MDKATFDRAKQIEASIKHLTQNVYQLRTIIDNKDIVALEACNILLMEKVTSNDTVYNEVAKRFRIFLEETYEFLQDSIARLNQEMEEL